jgi:hypothetical protein
MLKGQCTRIFSSGFFHESVSPQPQSIPLGSFQIFLNIRGDIRKSRCTRGINDTCGKFATGVNNTSRKVSMTLAANLLPVSTTPAANFATNFPSVVDTGGKFATGVNDTGGKFATDVKDAGGKLHCRLTISIVCFGLCVKYQ